MILLLDPADLKPEYQKQTSRGVDQNCGTGDISFENLNEQAQSAVSAVGMGMFYSWDRLTYNAVYSPRD